MSEVPVPMVPVARVRALVKLLSPEHMTPYAAHVIRRVLDEYETTAGQEDE